LASSTGSGRALRALRWGAGVRAVRDDVDLHYLDDVDDVDDVHHRGVDDHDGGGDDHH
jgi:hypothetical protein